MQRRMSYILPKRQHWLSRLMLALGFVSLYIIGGTPAIYADGTPGGNVADPVVRAVDVAKPAVVRIITTLNSHLVVKFSAAQSVTFPQGGSSYPVSLSGSGTFISAHGDILTADHVVNPPQDQSLSQFLDSQAAPDVANYINQNLKPSSPVTADQIMQELSSGQLPSTPNYDKPSSEAFLSTDFTGPLSAVNVRSLPPQVHASVDRIEQQSSFNEKDVAIVHVNMNDTASVQLGDSSSVQQQDKLTIIGFPGNGDVSTTPTNLLTSSINEVLVSSIKTTNQGAQLIQVAGNVEHGDSGGPALDSKGTVVGIVSFGLSDQGNTRFLQASNSARDLVQNLHLDTTPGAFQKAWSQAFSDYAANTLGHWHKAQQEFGQVAKNYPLFQAINPYLAYAQTQARKETTSSQPTQAQGNAITAFVLPILGIVVVIVLALLGFALVMRRRRKKVLGTPAMLQPLRSAPPNGRFQQGQNHPTLPAQGRQADGMAAFGAPPSTTQHSGQATLPGIPIATAGASSGLQPWPCGHMNRPNARYCIICGEPAPTRRIEQ